tara:strand:+ start:108 stop:338 length:231 start_codon:yes stop_codon:yes gene_type:complete
MNNPQVLKIIENLKGRKNYEEKRASKLGFASLYDYIEDKVLKKKEEAEAEIVNQSEKKLEIVDEKKFENKKSCSCC